MKILHLTALFNSIKKLNQTLQIFVIVLVQQLRNSVWGNHLETFVQNLTNSIMDNQPQQGQQPPAQPANVADDDEALNPIVELLEIDGNQIMEEAMDWSDESDVDIDGEEEEDDEEDDDDDDDDDVDYNEDGYSSSENSTWEVSHFPYWPFKVDVAHKEYCFQPLRLIKVNYKMQNSPSEYPLARSGHRVICSDSHLYSLGGYNPRIPSSARNDTCLLFQELWSFNFSTKEWKLALNGQNAPEMPRELASNALAIHNNVLISHGGTGFPFGETCSNDCYVYTTGEKSLVTCLKVTGDMPTALYGPGIVIHKDYLYTIGGTTGFDYSCDVYRLNLVTRVWENVYICRPEMRDDPEGRYRHEVVYDGHHIYVLGGGTSHLVYDLQRLPAFNLDTNRWDYFDTLPDRTVATTTDNAPTAGFPKPRKCFSCVQNTNSNGDVEAFITGGLQGEFASYFADIWKLNMRTKQWTWIRSASLPKPLYFHSAAPTSTGCMYIFGGIQYSEKDMRRRNDLFKMWMTIPKLSEICWDAITYYGGNLNRYDRKALLSSGIPDRYVDRLTPLKPKSANQKSMSNRKLHVKVIN